MDVAGTLVEALGGSDNIIDVEPCLMRIRATVVDPLAVDEEAIRSTNPLAVVRSGNYVQIIIGVDATDLAQQMNVVRPATVSQ